MPRRGYYRRQSDLCLQLALLQNDPQTTLLLAKLAKELQAKGNDVDGASTAAAPLKWTPQTPLTVVRDDAKADGADPET